MMSSGRPMRGPSLPAMATSQQMQNAMAAAQAQQAAMQQQLQLQLQQQQQSSAAQQRSRSYSTPDMAGQPVLRRAATTMGAIGAGVGGTMGVGMGGAGAPAVPGIPQHLHAAHHDANIPRSQTGSPQIIGGALPIRSNTQSPGVQRERMLQQGYGASTASSGGAMAQFPTQPTYARQQQQQGGDAAGVAMRAVNPPGAGTDSTSNGLLQMPMPTQLKVKVLCDSGNYFTLVVAINISYQTLIDRIDAKLARFTSASIAKGGLKLRYRDEDGDFVSIESDDDIQIAFLEWREGARNMYSGGVGEIELFCQGETS